MGKCIAFLFLFAAAGAEVYHAAWTKTSTSRLVLRLRAPNSVVATEATFIREETTRDLASCTFSSSSRSPTILPTRSSQPHLTTFPITFNTMPSFLDLFDPGVALAAFAASLCMTVAYYAWYQFRELFNDPLVSLRDLLMGFFVFIMWFRLSLVFCLAWSEGALNRFHYRRDDDDHHGSPPGTGTGFGSSSGAHTDVASQRSNNQKRASGDRARTRSNAHGAPHHRVSVAISVALFAVLMSVLIKTFTSIQFVSSRGNEYFCEIDEDYLTDRFNLTGLNAEVPYYQYALDLVTDVFDLDADDDLREQIEKSARHLYGLVHARYIVTTRGLAKMVRFPRRVDTDAI